MSIINVPIGVVNLAAARQRLPVLRVRVLGRALATSRGHGRHDSCAMLMTFSLASRGGRRPPLLGRYARRFEEFSLSLNPDKTRVIGTRIVREPAQIPCMTYPHVVLASRANPHAGCGRSGATHLRPQLGREICALAERVDGDHNFPARACRTDCAAMRPLSIVIKDGMGRRRFAGSLDLRIRSGARLCGD
jgi:hypothetical protein